MTPTEQDKELQKKLLDYFAGGAPSYKIANQSIKANARIEVNALMPLIDQYTKRVALEAKLNGKWEILSKIPDGTSVLDNGKIYSAYNLRIKVNREIAELKAQQEEV